MSTTYAPYSRDCGHMSTLELLGMTRANVYCAIYSRQVVYYAKIHVYVKTFTQNEWVDSI